MSIPESLMVALVGMLVVMVELALLAAIIILMSKIIREMTAKKAGKTEASNGTPETTASVVQAAALPKTQSAGSVNLHDVDDKTAAMLMAIVSDETGIPLNELRFQSIKALD